jgi:hypothetical protein
MAKKKHKKQKERERRVAQKKLTATTKKRDLEKTTAEPEQDSPEWAKLVTKVFPKTGSVFVDKKSPATPKHSGG